MRLTKVDKQPETLGIKEITGPLESGPFWGLSVGRGKKGCFLRTGGITSKTYPSLAEIPAATITNMRAR